MPPSIGYRSLDTYARACAQVARGDRSSIPHLLPDAAVTWEASIAGTIEEIEPSVAIAPLHVIAERGAVASLPAQLLASWFGGKLELVASLPRHTIPNRPRTVVVELADRIGDVLLNQAMELDEPPCFVTGDDVGVLSRFLGRLIDAGERPVPADRFRMLVNQKESSTYFAMDRGARPLIELGVRAPAEVVTIFAETEGVLMTHGHGGESCAQGAGPAVVCGRRGDAAFVDDGGDLNCRESPAGCPRGSRQLRVGDLRVSHLMLGSCSSGRLGDAAVASRYNFTRAFVEGPGLTMIGSATGGGRPECGFLYLGALADGLTLQQTVALLNRFLRLSRAGQPVYIAYGLPDLRVEGARAGAHGRSPAPLQLAALPASLELGERHVAFLEVRDPSVIAAAAEGDLSLSIDSGDSRVSWFGRVVGDGDQQHLALTIFSFPAPLGGVRVAWFSRRDAREAMNVRLAGLRRWLDLHRAIFGAESAGAREALRAQVEQQDVVPVVHDRLAFDGSALHLLREHLASLDAILRRLRDMLFDELAAPLTGGFWLTNAIAHDHGYEGAERATCPACGGLTHRRQLRAHLTEERRVSSVCMRCGIIEDVRVGSTISAVRVHGEERVPRGAPMKMRVEIATPLEGHEFVVLFALSGPHQPKIPAQTLRARSERGVAVAESVIDIPEAAPAHEYRFKCLVADGSDIAFAAHCVFVTRASDGPT
ncbi:MAG: hypothetical protein U0359_00710 [Byssovorax sp.]